MSAGSGGRRGSFGHLCVCVLAFSLRAKFYILRARRFGRAGSCRRPASPRHVSTQGQIDIGHVASPDDTWALGGVVARPYRVEPTGVGVHLCS